MTESRVCPCCELTIYNSSPGEFEICPRCGWEDDGLGDDGGTGALTLAQAREIWRMIWMAIRA